jgi:hypothetical protein
MFDPLDLGQRRTDGSALQHALKSVYCTLDRVRWALPSDRSARLGVRQTSGRAHVGGPSSRHAGVVTPSLASFLRREAFTDERQGARPDREPGG